MVVCDDCDVTVITAAIVCASSRSSGKGRWTSVAVYPCFIHSFPCCSSCSCCCPVVLVVAIRAIVSDTRSAADTQTDGWVGPTNTTWSVPCNGNGGGVMADDGIVMGGMIKSRSAVLSSIDKPRLCSDLRLCSRDQLLESPTSLSLRLSVLPDVVRVRESE